jgi:uncharacterized membrane protein YkoI
MRGLAWAHLQQEEIVKRWLLLATLAAAVTLVFTTGAVGGARRLIFDDGAYYQPGSLDDGKGLLPDTTVSLSEADATAQRVVLGELGQVDLEHFGDRIVYSVDVGSQEVRVDANTGIVVDIRPRD